MFDGPDVGAICKAEVPHLYRGCYLIDNEVMVIGVNLTFTPLRLLLYPGNNRCYYLTDGGFICSRVPAIKKCYKQINYDNDTHFKYDSEVNDLRVPVESLTDIPRALYEFYIMILEINSMNKQSLEDQN